MKIITRSGILMGLALLGATLTSARQPAEARPQRNGKGDTRRGDWRNNHDNDRDDYRDRNRRGQSRDDRRNQRPTRYRNNDNRYDDHRYGTSGYGYGNSSYGNGGYDYGNSGYGNGGYGYGNHGYGGNYGYDGGNNYGNQSFTGRVTKVKSADEFDLRIGSTTYNVYTDSRAPRGLRVGDTVRVYGQRIGKNDIRNASASLLSNRR